MIVILGMMPRSNISKPVNGISALKASVIFGANASGKSDLIKAIDFGRILILKGTKSDQNIKYQCFRLDETNIATNTKME